MTAFPTCKNCVLEKLPCARRDAIRKVVGGLGLTSIKLRCSDRKPLFEAGQRVSVTWPVTDYDDEYANSSTLETWPATVVQEVRSRFLIKVDDVRSDNETPASSFMQNPSLYAKVPSGRLKALDEPAQTVCATCGRVGAGPIGEGGCYGYARQDGYTGYVPLRCLARQETRESFGCGSRWRKRRPLM